MMLFCHCNDFLCARNDIIAKCKRVLTLDRIFLEHLKTRQVLYAWHGTKRSAGSFFRERERVPFTIKVPLQIQIQCLYPLHLFFPSLSVPYKLSCHFHVQKIRLSNSSSILFNSSFSNCPFFFLIKENAHRIRK